MLSRIMEIVYKALYIIAPIIIVLVLCFGIYKVYVISKGTLPNQEIEFTTKESMTAKEKLYYIRYASYRDYIEASYYTEERFKDEVVSKYPSEKDYMISTIENLIIENNWESEEDAIELAQSIAEKIYG